MKSSILKVLGSVIVASTCLMAYPKTSSAQANADLELVVSSPENSQVIPFGDTLHTFFSLSIMDPIRLLMIPLLSATT